MTTTHDPDKIRDDYHGFLRTFRSVLLATCDAQGLPEASYAPFITAGGAYWIYVSQLATHTQNLLDSRQASLLFIEDESNTNNLFARRRVSLQCRATPVERDTAEFAARLDQFEQAFGKFIQMLRSLQDFYLIRLEPLSGNYVAGFGKAYALEGEDLAEIRHRKV